MKFSMIFEAQVELGTPDDRVLPTSATSRQAGDVLRSSFAGDGTHPIQVVTTTSVPEAELTSYAATLGQLPDVVRVDVQAGRDADLVAVVTDLDPMSAAARALVDEVRAVPAPGGAEALVGGASAELHDQMTGIGDRLPLVAGWLVLTHGVGPMRKYAIGACLLDLENPARVIGRLREPLLTPNENEREGYVPNVVYSCGGLVHNDTLVIPYAMADYATTFSTVSLSELLSVLQGNSSAR